MYRTIKDFLNDWSYESSSTIKMFENLHDDCLKQTISEEVRKIATLAWHITTTPVEMLSKTGMHFEGPDEHSKAPETVAEIIEAYKKVAAIVTKNISENWSDQSLDDEINIYGETWTKGKTLSVLVLHQTHHRGQLTVLMRLCGLKVPGIYGPSKEEWSAMGMAAME